MTVAGLILNIVGVLFLFVFGFPQPSFEESVGIALEDNTPVGDGKTAADHAREQRRKRLTYRVCSLIGLSFVLVGFILQLIGAV